MIKVNTIKELATKKKYKVWNIDGKEFIITTILSISGLFKSRSDIYGIELIELI